MSAFETPRKTGIERTIVKSETIRMEKSFFIFKIIWKKIYFAKKILIFSHDFLKSTDFQRNKDYKNVCLTRKEGICKPTRVDLALPSWGTVSPLVLTERWTLSALRDPRRISLSSRSDMGSLPRTEKSPACSRGFCCF